MPSFSAFSVLLQRRKPSLLLPIILIGAMLLDPFGLRAVDWSTLFTAQDVRDHLATEKGRARRPVNREARDLERRLDLESPSFQQRLGNVLGVLVLARPLAEAG